MAPAPEISNSLRTVDLWGWLIAAIKLVVSSVMFWTGVGLFWLASRPATQQPIVIWMPPVTDADAANQTHSYRLSPAVSPQDNRHVAAD